MIHVYHSSITILPYCYYITLLPFIVVLIDFAVSSLNRTIMIDLENDKLTVTMLSSTYDYLFIDY